MTTQLADHFTVMFRVEHREIRDTLLDLVEAFQQRDQFRARGLVERTATLAGPHFRYEEESMYPYLVKIFGDEYIEKLLHDHDGAIDAARKLAGLSEKGVLSDDEIREAVRLTRSILPHVSDCDGLSIMVERLPDPEVETIFATRERSRAVGLDLLRWADEVRARPSTPAAIPT
ncbi:MAG TPA: hemerythrin domain-containing protein [Chloroflexota bacterium]|nr:hemerythrin domain-containing protein [Chloroflexota bacterium]